MSRAELMYKWSLFNHYRRMHGVWRALRFTFGNYYVMPVDHDPTPDEKHHNEMNRHERQYGTTNYGR